MDRKIYIAKIIKNVNQEWKLIWFDSSGFFGWREFPVILESRKIEKGERRGENSWKKSWEKIRVKEISLCKHFFLEIISSLCFHSESIVFPGYDTMWEIEEDRINRKAKFRVGDDRWTKIVEMIDRNKCTRPSPSGERSGLESPSTNGDTYVSVHERTSSSKFDANQLNLDFKRMLINT